MLRIRAFACASLMPRVRIIRHTRLFRCFHCYDMVETHGHVIGLLPPEAEYHVRPRHPDSFDRLPFLRQCKIVDQRMFDIVKDSTFGFGIRIGEDVFGHPSPIKTTLRVHRIRAEHGGDPRQRHLPGATISSRKSVIVDDQRAEFPHPRRATVLLPAAMPPVSPIRMLMSSCCDTPGFVAEMEGEFLDFRSIPPLH